MNFLFKDLNGLVWLLLMLGPLLFVQRWLHREIQAVFLLITRSQALTIGLFAFFFFPGVALHEASHFLMARLVGVRASRFSLLPKMLPDGRLRMGYVETETADFFRDALIGAAPLLSGGAVVAYLGLYCLGLAPLETALNRGEWAGLWNAFLDLPRQPDFWLWFYLAFTISSAMFPSQADRRGWLPVLLIILGLVTVAVLVGAGPWMLANLAPRFNTVLRALAVVFGISLLPHIVLALPVGLLRRLISRLTGLTIS